MSSPETLQQVLRFPPERPLALDELERLDAGRLEPVIQTLVSGLHGHWAANGKPLSDTARVWGVLGGLGQGKSTLVREVLARLQGRDKTQGIWPRVAGFMWLRVFSQPCGVRRQLDVKTLEASVLSSQHLSATVISRLVLPRLVLWALPMLILNFGLLLFALWWVLAVMGMPDALFRCWDVIGGYGAALLALPVVVAGLAAGAAWAKEQQQAGYWEFLLYRAADWLGVLPDLVVVDDLDRATVEQQKAVLRTLVRHTHLMRCPLIVCFDESELLASDPDPEDPAELLRKLIQVPLRLPPRSREDAVLLAWGAVAWWHRENPQRHAWGAFMRHPVWVGHLARLMMDTHSVGPRRAKYLLAEAVASVATAHCQDAEVDFNNACALLLLAAIYQIQPALRRDPELLLACLEAGGTDQAWTAWMDHSRASEFKIWAEKNPRQAAQLQILLRQSEAMMPVRTDWRSLCLGRVGAGARKPAEEALETWSADVLEKLLHHYEPNVYTWFLGVGAALDKIVLGMSGSEELDKLVPSQHLTPKRKLAEVQVQGGGHHAGARIEDNAVTVDEHKLFFVWPLMVAALSTFDLAQRRRFFETVDHWLGRMSGASLREAAQLLRAAWVKAWCSDEAWVFSPNGTVGEYEAWLVGWLGRLAADSEEGMRLVLARRLRRLDLTWLAGDSRTWRELLELESQGVSGAHLAKSVAIGKAISLTIRVEDGDDFNRLSRAALRYWPPITAKIKESALTELEHHMCGIRQMFPLLPLRKLSRLTAVHGSLDAIERPYSLLAWMASSDAQNLRLMEWLDLFKFLCQPKDKGNHWSFSHWRFFLFHAPARMSDGPAKMNLALSDRWCTAFCLWAQGWELPLESQPASDGVAEQPALVGVWRSLSQSKPDALDAVFVADALDWWGQSDVITVNTPDKIPFGLALLSTDQALELWRYSLLQANGVNIAESVKRCLQHWDRLAGSGSTLLAEFAVRARAEVPSGLRPSEAPESIFLR